MTYQLDQMYKDDFWSSNQVETEIFETPGKDLDFDQMNEER